MNVRQAIQPSNTPAVLGLSFSHSRRRFIAALSHGLRVFRTDNCLTTYQPALPTDGGTAIAEALDDRYVAFVGGGRLPAGKPSVVVFWDCTLDREVGKFDMYEPILGLRVGARRMVVVLRERAVVFEYQHLQQPTPPPDDVDDNAHPEMGDFSDEPLSGPNKVKTIYPTSTNAHAIARLCGDLLVLPAQSIGQIQLIPLSGGSKRVLRVHNSAVRCLTVSPDGSLLATASEQGTLIRVFDIRTLDQIAEFRRGVDHAIIFGLAISDGNRWLACTSDKGTLHIFDLRPSPAADSPAAPTTNPRDPQARIQQHRKSQSNPIHRVAHPSNQPDTPSQLSGRSSSPFSTSTAHTALYQGSVQEYYGLRPPPSTASPPGHAAAVSALNAFKASGWAPRVLKDVRSTVSGAFYTGNDTPHWQGGAAVSWTTAPGGTRKRVRNAVLPLPGDPSGRPPKGVVAFVPNEAPARGQSGQASTAEADNEGAVLHVIGGGSDARWERFEILPVEDGGWALVNRGFRRYLTRQFVD